MNIKRGRLLFLKITAIAICLITIIYFKPDEVAEVLALTRQESVEKKIAITFDDDVIIGLSQEISYKEAVSMI